jgi:hypothetical protein
MKMYGIGGMAPSFLTSALDGGGRSISSPGRLTPRETASSYPLDRRLDWPQSRSGRCGVETNFLSLPRIELWRNEMSIQLE